MWMDKRTVAAGLGLMILVAAAPFLGLSLFDSTIVGTVGSFALLLPVAVLVARGRGAAALPFAGFAAAGFTLLMAMASLNRTLISSHWECGTGLATLMLMAPFVMAGTAGACLVVGRALPTPLVRVGAIVLAVAALGAALPFAPGLAPDPRPAPDGWIASLPVVAIVPETTEAVQTYPVGELTLTRVCNEGYCSLGIAERPVDGERGEPTVGPKELVVQRDAAHGWLVIEAGYHHIAIDECTGAPVDVDVADVLDGVRAPEGWREASGLALLVAVGALLWMLALLVRRGRLITGRPCFVDAGGSVRFLDGRQPTHGVADLAIEPGPAIAFGHARPVTLPYREAPLHALRVLPGSRTEHLTRAGHRITAALGLACALVCVAAAPWLAFGLV